MQDWKSEEYRRLIGSGEVPPRPGVLQLMDDARAAGYKVAVCSAATKESVIFTLQSLLGPERFDGLDCFMAGDDVPRKKPDPIIYQLASGSLSGSSRFRPAVTQQHAPGTMEHRHAITGRWTRSSCGTSESPIMRLAVVHLTNVACRMTWNAA